MRLWHDFLAWLRDWRRADLSNAWRRDLIRRESSRGVDLAVIDWDAMRNREL